MGGETRLNLLLTHEERKPLAGQPWYQTLQHLLAPMGVRTFEATSGPQAVDLIERFPIHLAVVDSRLPAISGLNVLQLIHKLREQNNRRLPNDGAKPGAQPKAGGSFHFQMNMEEKNDGGHMQRRIEVRFDSRPADGKTGPAVILIAPPQQDQQLLQEALKFDAFTVLSEPVDVNLMLEVMARALRRFHQNQWPA
jgi:CheY-like chemotaxis protein